MSPVEGAPRSGAPGTQFLKEIHEQPDALLRLLAHEKTIARAAQLAVERDVRLIRLVGHGSSDNAASFGVYAFGLLPRWTAMRDAITLTVQTQLRDPITKLFQTETKALLNVAPRNILNTWQLASIGLTNRIQPMPPSIATLIQ